MERMEILLKKYFMETNSESERLELFNLVDQYNDFDQMSVLINNIWKEYKPKVHMPLEVEKKSWKIFSRSNNGLPRRNKTNMSLYNGFSLNFNHLFSSELL